MNVEQSMCAASGLASQWERIDWSQCEQRVSRLQARIVKATQEGRHGKVKALQWLLTFRIRQAHGKVHNPKVNFVRYADDFIITGSSKELLENEVKPLVERFMLERGLQLSPEKTCITHIEQGFDFLGQNLRKYGGKL